VDKRWLSRRIAIFTLSLGGILIAATIPTDPNKVIAKETNSIAPIPKNPFKSAISGAAMTEAYEDNVRVGVPIPGVIETIWAQIGDRVEKGDPLFSIDTREIRAQIEVDRQEIAVKQRQVELLEIQYQRLLSVKDDRAISEESLSTKFSELQVSQAELDAAVTKLAADETELERHIVRAPRNGTILRNTLHAGEYISAGGVGSNTTTANTTILNTPMEMIMGKTNYIQLRVDIDEQNASRFDPSQPAFGFPRSVLQHPFPLTFIRIEPFIIPKKSLTGESDERIDTRVLQVIYRLDPDPSFPIYIGQQFDVYIKATPIQKPEPAADTEGEPTK